MIIVFLFAIDFNCKIILIESDILGNLIFNSHYKLNLSKKRKSMNILIIKLYKISITYIMNLSNNNFKVNL